MKVCLRFHIPQYAKGGEKKLKNCRQTHTECKIWGSKACFVAMTTNGVFNYSIKKIEIFR